MLSLGIRIMCNALWNDRCRPIIECWYFTTYHFEIYQCTCSEGVGKVQGYNKMGTIFCKISIEVKLLTSYYGMWKASK